MLLTLSIVRNLGLDITETRGLSEHTQKGPEIPYSYATVLLCSRVAAQVHADTTPLAISPGLTLRLAVLNSSEIFVEYCVYLFCGREVSLVAQPAPKHCIAYLNIRYE